MAVIYTSEYLDEPSSASGPGPSPRSPGDCMQHERREFEYASYSADSDFLSQSLSHNELHHVHSEVVVLPKCRFVQVHSGSLNPDILNPTGHASHIQE